MNTKSAIFLRLLINRYHSAKGQAILKFLPKEDVQSLQESSIVATDFLPLLQGALSSLSSMHASWLQPLIEKFPAALHTSLIASLTERQKADFKTANLPALSSPAKAFLLNQICAKMKTADHLPVEYLEKTELTPLVQLTRGQLIEIADFLGLHDLAVEVRQIVNRNHLRNIYACLSSKQLSYLKLCLQQKEQLVSPKLGIDLTKQDCLKLKHIIHRRGLIRLGKALCGQHPDMVWHLTHLLDRGRGLLLLKEFQIHELPKITEILKQQLLNLIAFLSKDRSS